MFNTPTQIAISVDERNRRSVLELTAGDRPGLLCDVGKVLMEERVELHAAKIMTLGERAEDVFYVTDRSQRPLDDAAADAAAGAPDQRARPAPRHESKSARACTPIPSSGLRALMAGANAPRRSWHRISLFDRRAAACAARRSCWRRCAHNLDRSSAPTRPRAACRSCAPPGALAGAALPACAPAASIRTPWCCRSTAPARRCSPSCRPSSTAAATPWC